MRKKNSVKILALILAILMVLTLFTGIIASLRADGTGRTPAEIQREIDHARGQISNLEGQTAAIDAQIEENEALLDDLREQEGMYLEQLELLQTQLDALRARIEIIEEQIDIYERMIADKQARLEEAIEREQEQLELYQRRIRAMEERGRISYIQILLSARSFSELVTRIHDASEIMAADQRLSEALERYRVAVQDYKAELLADQEELEILIAQLESERDALQVEEANMIALIRTIEEQIQYNEELYRQLQAERERFEAEILAIAQDLSALTAEQQEAILEQERQMAANPGGGGSGGGGMGTPARQGTGHFVWPSDSSTRVTSGFGPRRSPGGIGSTNHRGIDIGAASGTGVLAAASGVVVRSEWNGGFGLFILIRHGNLGGDSYYTVYAHNSRNLVSAGDAVVQGQRIALVGSTGNSTGPHIHFEIIRNGVHVDPMIYFR